ncbi:hypothetical protein D3C73_1178370 [compost metagenome]
MITLSAAPVGFRVISNWKSPVHWTSAAGACDAYTPAVRSATTTALEESTFSGTVATAGVIVVGRVVVPSVVPFSQPPVSIVMPPAVQVGILARHPVIVAPVTLSTGVVNPPTRFFPAACPSEPCVGCIADSVQPVCPITPPSAGRGPAQALTVVYVYPEIAVLE